jgi:hypothetical protein
MTAAASGGLSSAFVGLSELYWPEGRLVPVSAVLRGGPDRKHAIGQSSPVPA